MTTPSLSSLPPDLQKIIQDYVAKEVSRLAQEAQLPNAPRVLSPHEQLIDHHQRAAILLQGDRHPADVSAADFHVLAALGLLIKEVEGLTNVTDATQGVDDSASSSISSEGAI